MSETTHREIVLDDKVYGTENGGVGGGHTIINAEGTEMDKEPNLQFGSHLTTTDDNTNEKTVVNLDITSLPDNITIIVKGDSLMLADYGPAGLKNARGNRGKDITQYFTDGTLGDRIAGTNGFHEFEDLELWDYIVMPQTITAPSSGGGSTTGTNKVHIGEFNPLNDYQFGNTRKNHIYMVPDTHFGMSAWNVLANHSNAHTTVGGYADSDIHKNILGAVVSTGAASGTINQQLKYVFGGMLQTTNELLTTAINATGYNRFGANSGCSSNWGWVQCQSRLMSEMEVHNGTVWSSSGYDTGNAKRQLPAFRNDQRAQYPQGIYFWEADIATATLACFAHGDGGGADRYDAGCVDYVRPRFVLAKAS